MKTCSECRKLSPDNANFCSYCGLNIEKESPEQTCWIIVQNVGVSYRKVVATEYTELETLLHVNHVDMLKHFGRFIIKCFSSCIESGILFTPIELYLIGPNGLIYKQERHAPIQISKPPS